jgi:hypothetical protein
MADPRMTVLRHPVTVSQDRHEWLRASIRIDCAGGAAGWNGRAAALTMREQVSVASLSDHRNVPRV